MIQLNVLRKILKKNFVWIIIFASIIIIQYILYLVDADTASKMLSTFIVSPGNKLTTIIAYKSILLIIIIYSFYIYEINNNYIYIFTRCKISKWISSKLLHSFGIILMYNFLYYIIAYLMYHSAFILTLESVLNTITLDILTVVIMITLINLSYLKKYAPFITAISILIVFENFKLIPVICTIFFLIIVNLALVLKFNALKNINE